MHCKIRVCIHPFNIHIYMLYFNFQKMYIYYISSNTIYIYTYLCLHMHTWNLFVPFGVMGVISPVITDTNPPCMIQTFFLPRNHALKTFCSVAGTCDSVGSICCLFDPGVKSVVIHMNFGQQQFDWVDLDSVLSKWQLPFSRISCQIAIVLTTWHNQLDDTVDGSEIQLTSLRLVVYPLYRSIGSLHPRW